MMGEILGEGAPNFPVVSPATYADLELSVEKNAFRWFQNAPATNTIWYMHILSRD